MEEVWLEYLTKEKAEELVAKCPNKLECKDGIIYLLDEIGDDFMTIFDNVEINLKGNEGIVDRLSYNYSEITTVECDPSLNVPNNTYYVFEPIESNPWPNIVYLIDRPMFVGHIYEVQITLAPNTYAEEGKPNHLGIMHLNGNITSGGEYLRTNLVRSCVTNNVTVCETLTYTFSPKEFGENAIRMSSRGVETKYDLAPRIATIKVKSL